MKTVFQVAGAIIGCFGLAVQLAVSISNVPANGHTYVSVVIFVLSFMTVWTNILVTVSYLARVAAPRSRIADFFDQASVQPAILVYITIVMVVYHYVLADLWHPKGWQWVADTVLHYVTPLWYALYWFAFAPKRELRWDEPFRWLLYPVAYFIYAMVYGLLSDIYTYPFIDITRLGLFVVMRNAALVSAVYLALGLLLVMATRLVRKKTTTAA